MLSRRRYKIKKETRQRIYFKVSKKLDVFYFDKRFGTIELGGSRDKSFFDRLFLNEFISKLQEEWKQEMKKRR